MANYVLGLGGNCCTDCTPDNPCTSAPVVSSGSVTGCVGTSISIGPYGTNTPTSRTCTGLPAGLSFNSGTGVISGTPTTAGTTTATYTATNACGTGTGTLTFIIGTRVTITSALTATAVYGSPFSYFITGSPTPTGFTASGLPPGFSLDSGTGEISSTNVSWRGSYSVTIGATDGGLCPGSATLVITSDCLEPTLVADAVYSTKTKTGFGENTGYESTPPKIYLKNEWSGTLTFTTYIPPCVSPVGSSDTTFAGYCEYDRDGAIINDSKTVAGAGAGTYCDTRNFAGSICPDPTDCANTTTATTITNVGNGVCFDNVAVSGTVTETLSNEFTTAQLISDTQAAMPSFPGTWADTPVTIRDLSSDEITYAEQQSQYKFELPSMTGVSTYGIAWVERFTPYGGGSPTDTPRSYTWNGTDTETGVYTLPVPASNGETHIEDIVITCT